MISTKTKHPFRGVLFFPIKRYARINADGFKTALRLDKDRTFHWKQSPVAV